MGTVSCIFQDLEVGFLIDLCTKDLLLKDQPSSPRVQWDYVTSKSERGTRRFHLPRRIWTCKCWQGISRLPNPTTSFYRPGNLGSHLRSGAENSRSRALSPVQPGLAWSPLCSWGSGRPCQWHRRTLPLWVQIHITSQGDNSLPFDPGKCPLPKIFSKE